MPFSHLLVHSVVSQFVIGLVFPEKMKIFTKSYGWSIEALIYEGHLESS